MNFVAGFMLAAVPAIVLFIWRNKQLAESNRIGIEMKRAEREQYKEACRAYGEQCRRNAWPIPMSTDEFYKQGWDRALVKSDSH